MFISLQALMGFIPKFYMKQEASLQLIPLKFLKPHYYLKNYLTIGELQIFQPFIKRAINQNFASQFDLYYVQTRGKKVRDYLLDNFCAITFSAIVKTDS